MTNDTGIHKDAVPAGGETAGNEQVLPVVPLRNTVVFPQQIVPLTIGRELSLKSVKEAVDKGTSLLVVAQKEEEIDEPAADDLYPVGTTAKVLKIFQLPDGSQTVMIQGMTRARIIAFERGDGHLRARITDIAEQPSEDTLRTEALVTSLESTYQEVADLAPYLANEHVAMVHNAQDPGHVADLIASTLQIKTSEKQRILETASVQERLEAVHRLLNREKEMLELSSKIQSEVQGEISKSQREYWLREQLKAIKRELGEEEGADAEIEELRQRVADSGMPQEAEAAALETIERLERINPASPEYAVARNYVDWLLDMPWAKETEDSLDLDQARETLDRDHYDLEKVKKRIVEFLAVRKLKKDMKGPILCFVGPPGVGKTSLGRSIAEALGRKFVRMSLGGMRDEAEIRGHRRTYVGALPGRIVQGLKKAGTRNPVFVLDEIDKLGSDFRGDPSSALLEVLDPEQNSSFVDHYLEVPIDLSDVMFIATANWSDPIPAPLRDRMEVITIEGYTAEDKIQIAMDHLIPRQIEAHGLTPKQVTFQKQAVEAIITDYTREAGVRQLDRTIAAVIRAIALEIARGDIDSKSVTADDLRGYLGPKKFYSEVDDRVRHPGVAAGLAWTPYGGEILFIEATRMPGKGRLTLTGQLGDVMKESAQAALSWIRSEADALGLEPGFLDETDVHIHVPAGAVPKDGPSAGVTMVTALVSLFTGRPVKKGIAMTGEVTLRGLVLPVGGIREKVLAARRAGLKTVILPERNRADVEEIPEDLKKQMRFIFVKDVMQVLQHSLSKRRYRRRRTHLD